MNHIKTIKEFLTSNGGVEFNVLNVSAICLIFLVAIIFAIAIGKITDD